MRRLALAIVSAALACAIAACGDAGASIAPLADLATSSPVEPSAQEVTSLEATTAQSESPSESDAPSPATEAPATPEPTAEVATPKPLPVAITNRTNPVDPGDTASVIVKTGKGAKCSITVEYESGVSTAKGLSAKRANNSGKVTWKWMIGSATNPQRVPITVLCDLGQRSGGDATAIRVR